MDLFDMTEPALQSLNMSSESSSTDTTTSYTETSPHKTSHSKSHPPPPNPSAHLPLLANGMKPLSSIPALVLGVQSDILFTIEQQREVADALRMAGNNRVSYYELGGVWGHDTFLYVFFERLLSCTMLTAHSLLPFLSRSYLLYPNCHMRFNLL